MGEVDHFKELVSAISRLQFVLRSMGQYVELAEIRLAPSHDGFGQSTGDNRSEFMRVVRDSPMYRDLMVMESKPKSLSPNVVCEIMGVRVTVPAVAKMSR